MSHKENCTQEALGLLACKKNSQTIKTNMLNKACFQCHANYYKWGWGEKIVKTQCITMQMHSKQINVLQQKHICIMLDFTCLHAYQSSEMCESIPCQSRRCIPMQCPTLIHPLWSNKKLRSAAFSQLTQVCRSKLKKFAQAQMALFLEGLSLSAHCRRGWTRWSLKILSNPNHCMILAHCCTISASPETWREKGDQQCINVHSQSTQYYTWKLKTQG